MATSTKADVVIYNEEYFSGIIEVVEQYADDVNTQSNGAVNYVTESLKGDFEKRSFWDLSTGVTDRDPTDVTDVTPTGLSQSELISPKMNMRIGPFQATLDQFRKLGETPETMSFVLGQQMGAEIAVEWLNRGLTAATACLSKAAGTQSDITGETADADKVISSKALNRTLGLMGDRRNRVVAWVMHSSAFTDLTEGQIVDKLPGNSDVIMYGGITASLGLPVLVTDSQALYDVDPDGDSSNASEAYILGLTEDAVRMIESEDRAIELSTVLGKANILRILQGEMALTVRMKGFSYSGSASPNLAAIGTSSNWDSVFTDIKSGPGVMLKCRTAGSL